MALSHAYYQAHVPGGRDSSDLLSRSASSISLTALNNGLGHSKSSPSLFATPFAAVSGTSICTYHINRQGGGVACAPHKQISVITERARAEAEVAEETRAMAAARAIAAAKAVAESKLEEARTAAAEAMAAAEDVKLAEESAAADVARWAAERADVKAAEATEARLAAARAAGRKAADNSRALAAARTLAEAEVRAAERAWAAEETRSMEEASTLGDCNSETISSRRRALLRSRQEMTAAHGTAEDDDIEAMALTTMASSGAGFFGFWPELL